MALRRARSYRDLPCLLAGDFNAIAPGDEVVRATLPPSLNWMSRLQGGRVLRSVVRRTQAEGFVDCFRHSNPADAGFTVPAGRPNTRLDYLFANAQLAERLVSCSVVRDLEEASRASDYYPVLARFAFDDEHR